MRNRLLWSTKSAGGMAMRTPVIPPITNVTMKPRAQWMGVENRMLPPYMVNSQLKTLTPVGTEMIIVAIPKKAFTLAPAPMVKKWCSHTMKDSTQMAMVAITMDRYPNSGLAEKVAMTSEKTP